MHFYIMEFFTILMCLILLFVESTDCNRMFCGENHKPVLTVCQDQEVTRTRTIYIDTIGVQYNRHTSCDCVITPSRQHLLLNLNLVQSAGRYTIEFKINEIKIGKYYLNKRINITGATKLLFSTPENHATGGVCLAVYTLEATFNISCTSEKTTTWTSPSSISHTSKTTEYKTLKPIHSTEQTSTERDNGENDENVTEERSFTTVTKVRTKESTSESKTFQHSTVQSSAETENGKRTTGKTPIPSSTSSSSQGTVTYSGSTTIKRIPSTEPAGGNAIIISLAFGLCGFVFGIVIVFAICYRRKRKAKETKTTTRQSKKSNVECDYYMTENPMYNMDQDCVIGTNTEEDRNKDTCYTQNDSTVPSHYESIQETVEEDHTSDHPKKHVAPYDYAICLAPQQNNGCDKSSSSIGATANKAQNTANKTHGTKLFSVMAKDENVYDSTNAASSIQGIGLNDYDHLSSVSKTGKCLTYDTVAKTEKL